MNVKVTTNIESFIYHIYCDIKKKKFSKNWLINNKLILFYLPINSNTVYILETSSMNYIKDLLKLKNLRSLFVINGKEIGLVKGIKVSNLEFEFV